MSIDKPFKDIKSCFCFLDETGLLYKNSDRFFGLGVVKCSKPQKIYKQIRKIRDRYNYREEMKWSNLDRRVRLDVAIEFFNIFMAEDIKFNCLILNK